MKDEWFYDGYRDLLFNTKTGVSLEIARYVARKTEGYTVKMVTSHGDKRVLMKSEDLEKAQLYLMNRANDVNAKSI